MISFCGYVELVIIAIWPLFIRTRYRGKDHVMEEGHIMPRFSIWWHSELATWSRPGTRWQQELLTWGAVVMMWWRIWCGGWLPRVQGFVMTGKSLKSIANISLSKKTVVIWGNLVKSGEYVLTDSGLACSAIGHGESANVDQQVKVMQKIGAEDVLWDICHDEHPWEDVEI